MQAELFVMPRFMKSNRLMCFGMEAIRLHYKYHHAMGVLLPLVRY